MAVKSVAVHSGMMVRDVHRKELGRVSHVWPYAPLDCFEDSPIGYQAAPDADDVGWFCVDRGGILSVGAVHFYLPFKTIDRMQPDGSITLRCTVQECEDTYTRRPWFTSRDIK